MTRSRATAKAAGTTFATKFSTWLAVRLNDDRIERRTLTGSKDRGDVTGVKTIRGGRVCLELKDYGGRFHVSEWLREVEIESGNDDAVIAAVVAKRRGVTDPAQQVVFMTGETLARLLEGGPDDAPVVVADPMTVVA